jgi:hypothetical protein
MAQRLSWHSCMKTLHSPVVLAKSFVSLTCIEVNLSPGCDIELVARHTLAGL